MFALQEQQASSFQKQQVLKSIAFLQEARAADSRLQAALPANEIDLLIFFRDPLSPKPHEPSDHDLLRLCDVHNIPFATNIATAEALIRGVERGDFEWREIVNPRYNQSR